MSHTELLAAISPTPKRRFKSLVTEAKQISRVVELINLGARMQVLEDATDLSYERLIRLYKEVTGKSPSKGQLPFSMDWFMSWQENIHATLFVNIHEYLNKVSELDEFDAIIKAYRLYLEQTQTLGLEAMLSITRAWRLVKFFDNGMLTMTQCSKCAGHFVTHPHEISKHYVCGLCNVPARAGRGSMAGKIKITPPASRRQAPQPDAGADFDPSERVAVIGTVPKRQGAGVWSLSSKPVERAARY